MLSQVDRGALKRTSVALKDLTAEDRPMIDTLIDKIRAVAGGAFTIVSIREDFLRQCYVVTYTQAEAAS